MLKGEQFRTPPIREPKRKLDTLRRQPRPDDFRKLDRLNPYGPMPDLHPAPPVIKQPARDLRVLPLDAPKPRPMTPKQTGIEVVKRWNTAGRQTRVPIAPKPEFTKPIVPKKLPKPTPSFHL